MGYKAIIFEGQKEALEKYDADKAYKEQFEVALFICKGLDNKLKIKGGTLDGKRAKPKANYIIKQ